MQHEATPSRLTNADEIVRYLGDAMTLRPLRQLATGPVSLNRLRLIEYLGPSWSSCTETSMQSANASSSSSLTNHNPC
jgi:hypothetical protein